MICDSKQKLMVHNSCCVVNCKNTGRNSDCRFYTFPTASWKIEKRRKWINAVKRKNVDGSPWTPKPTDTICSDHFVGGKKAEEETSPSYIPTIFPSIYRKRTIDEKTALSRHTRFLKRRLAKTNIAVLTMATNTDEISENNQITLGYTTDPVIARDEKLDKDCQADFLSNSNETGITFICRIILATLISELREDDGRIHRSGNSRLFPI